MSTRFALMTADDLDTAIQQDRQLRGNPAAQLAHRERTLDAAFAAGLHAPFGWHDELPTLRRALTPARHTSTTFSADGRPTGEVRFTQGDLDAAAVEPPGLDPVTRYHRRQEIIAAAHLMGLEAPRLWEITEETDRRAAEAFAETDRQAEGQATGAVTFSGGARRLSQAEIDREHSKTVEGRQILSDRQGQTVYPHRIDFAANNLRLTTRPEYRLSPEGIEAALACTDLGQRILADRRAAGA